MVLFLDSCIQREIQYNGWYIESHGTIPLYTLDPDFVITVPADIQAPTGATPSADRSDYNVTCVFYLISRPFSNSESYLLPSGVIQNGQRNLAKYRGTSSIHSGRNV